MKLGKNMQFVALCKAGPCKEFKTISTHIMPAEHTPLNSPKHCFECGKTLRDYRGRAFSSEISRSACASIFDMLHSFAPRYSHPSIRPLQPSLMLRPCKNGQRQGCGHTQTFLKRFRCQLRQANMKNPAGPKVRAETFYDVSS